MSQLDLFARTKRAEPVSTEPDLDKIRTILGSAIRQLSSASAMPWDAPTLRSWSHVFRNMSKWLPREEGEAFCERYRAELVRLGTDGAMVQVLDLADRQNP